MMENGLLLWTNFPDLSPLPFIALDRKGRLWYISPRIDPYLKAAFNGFDLLFKMILDKSLGHKDIPHATWQCGDEDGCD